VLYVVLGLSLSIVVTNSVDFNSVCAFVDCVPPCAISVPYMYDSLGLW